MNTNFWLEEVLRRTFSVELHIETPSDGALAIFAIVILLLAIVNLKYRLVKRESE